MENMKSTSAFIGLKWHAKFCRSRIRRSGNQALVLVLCVALSVVTLAALSSFAESTNRSILNDARSLHASDIILRSNYPFEQSLLDEVERTKSRYGAQSARVYSFYSVVRSPDGEDSLLVGIKAPEKGYPFYGEVRLASGRKFSDVLAPGVAIVAPMVLEGLGLRIGDEILVGNAGLTIGDAVLAEPDRPVNLFSLGPRVFVSFEDLDKLGLVTEASRVNYRLLAKVRDPEQLSEVFEVLKKAAGDHVGIDTFETARSSVKRFFNNFVFFLNLTGIFTLLLAGIGIRSTVEALLREETDSMAIMKTLGAKSRFILLNYTLVVSALGVAGAILGLVAGLALQSYLPAMFADFLPKSLEIGVSVGGVARGLALGILSAALFALLPLLRLRNVKPTAIFGKEPPRQKKDVAFFAAAFFIACVFSALVLWQLDEIKAGLYYIPGFVGFIAVSTLSTQAVLWALKKIRFRSLVLRQAVRGLFRPGNATAPTVVTLSASLSLLFCIYIVERNIDDSFVKSFPENSPNLFFVNILPDQKEKFPQVAGIDPEFFPIVRARIESVAGEAIDAERERKRRGDNLARSFNLTYRETLLEDEKIVRGEGLFGPGASEEEPPPVSVLDQVAEISDMKIGDAISFDIQGVPLTAKISSIRTRTREAMGPYFYFVFPESVLKNAPHTFFTAARVGEERVAPMRNRVVSAFPNVSVVDLSQTIRKFSELIEKLTGIVRFFSAFSILAGLLIIVGAIFATRYARIREAVYFKILGAKRVFVLKIFGLENMMIGLISATLALILAQIAATTISWKVLDIPHDPRLAACVLVAAAFSLATALIGTAMSAEILRLKPAEFLREREENG